MARVPVPGRGLTGGGLAPFDARAAATAIPGGIRAIAILLREAGHEAHLVGGCVRDLLRGVRPGDWDIATDARPDRLLALLPGARYENRFGTVVVPMPDGAHEVTTFRRDGAYSDHRRPDDVTFGDALDEDLARRDFTINAMAIPLGADGTPGEPIDRFGGREDLAAGILRAVGDPRARFREDALRMLRAMRFAATLGFTVEPATQAGITAEAHLAALVSAERTFAELARLLAADRPSVGLRLAEETGLLAVIAPDLARQRGVPHGPPDGGDLWDHTCRTVDAAAPAPEAGLPLGRAAALLHAVGTAPVDEGGRPPAGGAAGAERAAAWLAGLRAPKVFTERVANIVRHHEVGYGADWSAATVRRWIRSVGVRDVEAVLDLRAAANVASGLDPGAGGVTELRARCREQLDRGAALHRPDLAVSGDDLMSTLGIPSGPGLGRLLDQLLELVIVDPALNEHGRLIDLARDLSPGPADARTSRVATAVTAGDGGLDPGTLRKPKSPR